MVEHAEAVKTKAAERAGLAVDDVTFVGIHNRRTDYLEFMALKYGEKSQFHRQATRLRGFGDSINYVIKMLAFWTPSPCQH